MNMHLQEPPRAPHPTPSPRLSRAMIESIRSSAMELGETRQLVLPCPTCGESRIIMARQVRKEDIESNPLFAEYLQMSSPTAAPAGAVTIRRTSKYAWHN